MRQITQTVLATDNEPGVFGNCVQAAVASLMGMPLEAVPHFVAFTWWEGALKLWIRGHGMDVTWQKAPPIPQERALLLGKSPRGYGHAVVSEGGAIVWDPHPSGDGLTEVDSAVVFHDWEHSDSACWACGRAS